MNRLIASVSILTLFVAGIFSAFTNSSWSSVSAGQSLWRRLGAQQENITLKVGVAKTNITPQTPVPMSGYGSRDEVFKGIHDSLYATAVVFDDGNQKAVLVTADLIGFSNQFCKETTDMIEKAAGIPGANVLISATHNHDGPVNNTYGINENKDVADYVAFMQIQLVAVVVRASKNLVPARIGTGTGSCNMNINRRALFADGNIWLGRNPDGPCDKDVSVVRIDDVSKNTLAVLINWPCHGTTGGPNNYQISGDWPGATSRFVESGIGGEVIVPVTIGASGDINPIYGPNDQFSDIDAIGNILAIEVIKVTESVKTHDRGSISTAKRTIIAKGRKPTDNRLPNQKLEPAADVEIYLSVLRVGAVVFAGISGEVMTEIGMEIKKQSPYSHTVVVTHCNGSAGYLLTDDTYKEGGYEAMVSKTMPGTADQIIENLNQMIRSLSND